MRFNYSHVTLYVLSNGYPLLAGTALGDLYEGCVDYLILPSICIKEACSLRTDRTEAGCVDWLRKDGMIASLRGKATTTNALCYLQFMVSFYAIG